MNRSDIRTEVRDILGEDAADFWKDAELNRYIQEALYRFAAEERWPWYITEFTGTLSATDGDLELTVDIVSARHINFVLNVQNETRTWQPMRVSPEEGAKLGTEYSGSTGTYPAYFYVAAVATDTTDDQFVYTARFIPAPTDNVDVVGQYYRAPAELDADVDIPELPLRYHKALVHYAAAAAWLKELVHGGEKAQEQMSMYGLVLAQAKEQEMAAEPDDTPLVAGGDFAQASQNYTWTVRIAETLGP